MSKLRIGYTTYITYFALFVIVGLLASLIIRPAESQFENWKNVTTSNGSHLEKRHEASGVRVGNIFYLIGGRGEKSTDGYNVKTNKWVSYDSPPVEIHHFQAAVWNNDIYIVSAMEGDYPSEDPISNILIFDTATKKWSTGASIPSGRNRGSSGVVTYNNEIYVVSGTTNGHSGGFVNWVDKYNPATNKWTRLANIPTPRDHFTAEVIDGKIVVAGGRQTNIRNTSTWHNTVSAVNVYNIDRNSWAVGDKLPAKGAGTTSAVCGDEVIILGGETTASSANNDVTAFDIDTYTWRSLPDMINGRHGGGAFIYNNVLHAMSGSTTKAGRGETTAHEKLDLGSQCSNGSSIETPPPTGAGAVSQGVIQAENYTSQSGTRIVSGRDGNNDVVGYIHSGDSTTYSIDVTQAGSVEVVLRVSSAASNGGKINFVLGGKSIGSVTVPNTEGWNKFITISTDVTLPSAGNNQTLRLEYSGGLDINWFKFVPAVSAVTPEGAVSQGVIQAENYTSQSGTRIVSGRDGNNDVVGYIHNGDSTTYSIDVTQAGSVEVVLRVSSAASNGGKINFVLGGKSIGSVTVPNTGGWNKFITISTDVTLPSAGNNQTLRLEYRQGLDINWFEFE